MDITITLVPAGNTTRGELASLADEVEQALRAERAVTDVRRPEGRAPDGAKGVASAIGGFLVGLPPSAISGALGVVRSVLAGSPETPTKVKISADGGVELEFDHHTTPEQMLALVNGIRAQPPKPA